MALTDKLKSIADAIRGKTGKTEELTLDQMATEITGISAGIDTSDATVSNEDIMDGKTAYANGEKITGTFTLSEELSAQDALIQQIESALVGKGSGGGGLPTQEKTVEITENGTVEVVPDAGYALSKVTAVVDVPIPDGYIQPSGTLEVTENGTHDVSEYASVNVNVPTGDDSSDLPAGYRRVDYIQFTGEQIVDMEIVGNQNTSIQIVFTRERSTQHYLFGASSSENTASITGYMGGSWRYGNKYATKNPITDADMIYSCTMDNSQVTITGSKTAISGVNDFETVGSLLLGACRNSDGTLGAPQFIGKVLFAAAGQGGELVQKLVAVTDGTVFRFWDAIEKKFHDSITDTPLGGGNF